MSSMSWLPTMIEMRKAEAANAPRALKTAG
jgi:hypothetical protein